MKNIINDYQKLIKYSKDLSGVFSLSDLKCLMNEENSVLMYRRIKNLQKENLISRFKNGYYILKEYSKEVLSNKVKPESYISFGNVLSKELLIGSVPQNTVYAVKTGRNRNYSNNELNLVYMGINSSLFFGFNYVNGVAFANPEKALLDTLYYYQKGQKYSFDIFSDINISKLNFTKFNEYLILYKNPKFIAFVKGYIKNADK